MNDYKNFGIRIEGESAALRVLEQTAERLSLSFCDVFGFGELEWVDLVVDDDDSSVRRFEGPFQLIDLKGRIRVAGAVTLSEFVCTLARQTDNGIQILGGKLSEAGVLFAEITFCPLVPLESTNVTRPAAPPVEKEYPTREMRPSSPPLPSTDLNSFGKQEKLQSVYSPSKPVSAPSEQKTNKQDTVLDNRWAKAVLESKQVEESSALYDDDSDVRPKRGDFVFHNQFGECTVSRIDDDHITLRKPDGRNVQLGLTVLRFVNVGKHKGKDAFQVKIDRKNR